MKAAIQAAIVTALLSLCGCAKPMPPEPEVKTTMEMKSSSFASNQAIPDKYSAYGANVSPALSWSNPPEGTKSYVLLLEDPDAPRSTPFVHWLVYNIPSKDMTVSEGQPPEGATAGKNDAGTTAYFGPKPPSGTHHYHFKLYAIDETLPLAPGATKDKVLKEIQGHTLGKAELVGTYSH